MFQFLSPVWLWALAAVAVPIAIHLWNKKPPQTVAVGSIRWLQPSQSQKLSSLYLAQPWLLLLRCLIISLLAFMLAEPFISRQVTAPPERHVYLHPTLLQDRYLPQIAAAVDSLAAQGWRIHKLQPGFPELNVSPDTPLSSFATPMLPPDSTDAWALLRVLNGSLPAHARAQIFSTDLLRHHRGAYPAMRQSFTWIPVSVPQTNTWLQEAYPTPTGELLVRLGNSEGLRVTFQEHRIAKPAPGQTITLPGGQQLKVTTQPASDSVALVTGAANALRLTMQPLSVLIRYSPSREEDVRYLRAALQAALSFKAMAHELSVSREDQPLPAAAPDWVFWLSNEPISLFLARFPENSLKILVDAREEAKVQKTESWLQVPGLPETLPMHQRTMAPDLTSGAGVLWQDGFGQPLLTVQPAPPHSVYRFYSRFHPAWNGFPDSGRFPELLLRLLFPENEAWRTLFDTRALPQSVERPRLIPGSFPENRPDTEIALDLKPWLLALAALLLVLERWMATRLASRGRAKA